MSDLPSDSQVPETGQSHASEAANEQPQSYPAPPPSPSVLSERTTPEPAMLPPSSGPLASGTKANRDSDPDETIAVHQAHSQKAATSDPAGHGNADVNRTASDRSEASSQPASARATDLPDAVAGADHTDQLASAQPLTPATIKPRGGGRGGARHQSTNGTPRGRGGKPGRPRGRGRGGGAAGRNGIGKRKRKRNNNDDDDDDDDNDDNDDGAASDLSTSSEEFVAVSMTKSGRAVQKPTSYVPPQNKSTPQATGAGGGSQAFASPSGIAGPGGLGSGVGTASTGPNRPPPKKKRMYRRNPEAAVCKVCLRGTSPTKNMIVFCDGCNQAYHRYCHVPVISQEVVDKVDKEWFCSPCEKERAEVVSEDAVAGFVSAEDASYEEKQRYFTSLPRGMLVTLLMRATTQRPDLPLFPPDFVSESATAGAAQPGSASKTNGDPTTDTTPQKKPVNGHTGHSATPPLEKLKLSAFKPAPRNEPVPDEHPPTYPRPGHGIQQTLPSEHENSERLVDDGDRYGVFTHLYQVDQAEATNGLSGRGRDGEGGKVEGGEAGTSA